MNPNPYLHVDDVMRAVRQGLHDWVGDLMGKAGLEGFVSGVLPDPSQGAEGGPHLVVLPYQSVLESQAGVPTMTLVPIGKDAKRDSLPKPWQIIAHGMTSVLVEQFPQRGKKAPGLGPLHPSPLISELPGPIARWYHDNPDWTVGGGERAKLPQISWRHPFSMVVRFASVGVDTRGETPNLDEFRLRALAVLAAGIRIERFYPVELPPFPVTPELESLIESFAAAAPGELGERMREAVEAQRLPMQTAIGLTPHHELSDNDIALMMEALRQPMQPCLVFAVRMALGGGPELIPGAMPHLPPVGKAPE